MATIVAIAIIAIHIKDEYGKYGELINFLRRSGRYKSES
jgi:hypothetical protein